MKAHPEEDRIETEAAGFQIRVWRTKINTKTRFHLGYKAPWDREYYKISVDNLIEMLTKRRGTF